MDIGPEQLPYVLEPLIDPVPSESPIPAESPVPAAAARVRHGGAGD